MNDVVLGGLQLAAFEIGIIGAGFPEPLYGCAQEEAARIVVMKISKPFISNALLVRNYRNFASLYTRNYTPLQDFYTLLIQSIHEGHE